MHYRFLWLLSMIVIFSTLSASFNPKDTLDCELNAQIISQLLEENDPSIIKVENEKVFILAEKIWTTDRGIFLSASGKSFLIPQLLSSSDGCYVSHSQPDSTIYPRITCRNCGKVFNPNIFNQGKCPQCGFQN